MDESSDVKFFWKLENFCFCDLYPNARLSSPLFKVCSPIRCQWLLYMFPNGHGNGTNKDVGIYLKRGNDDGPEEIRVSFKISLLDNEGYLSPETPPIEKNFSKDCEWGHNEYIKRCDIATDSMFLLQDALTVVCQITFIDLPQRTVHYQPSLQSGEDEEIKKVCKAVNLLYKNNLYSDMELIGNGKSFNIHRCILRTREPVLYSKLMSLPNTIFDDDFLTDKLLSYVYSGKLDIQDLAPINIKSKLKEYGLIHLEKRLISQCNEFFAQTHFEVKRCTYSWKIFTELLSEKEEIYSQFISDGFEKTEFLICLHKDEDGVWKTKIKASTSSNDDVFVRCNILVQDSVSGRITFESCEHPFKSNTWWLCPTSLRLQDNILFFNNQSCTFDSGFFSIDFTFTYPSGRIFKSLEMTTSNHTSTTDYVIDDLKKFQTDLEGLYHSQNEADFTVVVATREFKVHKCILCIRSPYFRAMLKHDMSEKKENLVHLKNEHLDDIAFQEVIDKLLLFTYCGKFEARSADFAAQLLEAIDMYMIGKDYEDL